MYTYKLTIQFEDFVKEVWFNTDRNIQNIPYILNYVYFVYEDSEANITKELLNCLNAICDIKAPNSFFETFPEMIFFKFERFAIQTKIW